jgi:hypothetical protein
MEHNFGVCSQQTLQGMTTDQYPLSTTENTTFRFEIIFEGLKFCVHCTFKPFRRKNLTFHDIEIQSLIPPKAPPETVCQSKGPIAEVAQCLYDRCFKEKAGYHFIFTSDECAIEMMLFSRANYLTASSS